MKTETYKGRKLKVVKGTGRDWGRTRQYVNGVDQGAWQGDEDAALRQLRGDVDFAESVGPGSGRCAPEWFAPGTFELCEEGHAKEIGGLCGHHWCVEQRTVISAPEVDEQPLPVKVVTPSDETSRPYAGTGYVKDLMMGDVFRLPGNPHEVFGPVRSADSDYMLYGTNVDFGHGNRREWHAWTRVEHLTRGPKCACGRFLELCENECPWPEEMEALFMAH
nr:hypothetical protein OG513_07555 [Streptomyces sp. NBC_00998]